jgi:LemA protein
VTIVLGILITVIVVILGWRTATRRRVGRLRSETERLWAPVQELLDQRRDLIPSLVDTVEDFAPNEEQTYVQVLVARAQVLDSRSNAERHGIESQLSLGVNRLLGLAANHAELLDNAMFVDLRRQLGDVEGELIAAAEQFNDAAQTYNSALKAFPTSLVARPFGFSQRPYFEITEADQALRYATDANDQRRSA